MADNEQTNANKRRATLNVQSKATTGPSTNDLGIFLLSSLFSRSGRRRTMLNNEKRSTRSQTNIPDYFVPLDQSPLKQARSAIRNADVIVATDPSGVGSPTGATGGKKRSASPPAINREENPEREVKRSKTSANENEAHESSPSGWKLQTFSSSSIPSVLPPPSISGSTTPTRSVGPSPRARSVPPSIPTTPGRVPYLDLSKYRSPKKSAHKVRVMSVPPPSSSIRDGEKSEEGAWLGKAVDRNLDKTPVPRMVIEKVEKVRRTVDHPPPALVVAPTSGSRNDDPFSLEPDVFPKTLVQKNRALLEPMSPLTPLSSPSLFKQLVPPTSLLPSNDITDSMDLDPPDPLPQPKPQLQPEPPSPSKPDPRPGSIKRPSHLIPPQPKPLSFPLPSRSPTPPSRRVSRSRSASVDPPIPALPYPLLPSTSNASNDPAPTPEQEPAPPDPQPEKHDSSELTSYTATPATTEPVAPAPVSLPVPDKPEPDEKGKGKVKERVPEQSKLPATKSTKASRLRSTAANTGPSGVTRTKATRVTTRPTPMSREKRVTRSSTAKSRQADVLKEKATGPKNLETQPKGDGGETGKAEKRKDGKDNADAGINIAHLALVFEREPDTRLPIL